MNTLQQRTSVVFTRVLWVAIGLIVLGATVVILAIGFDWEGFLGGFGLGAGVGAMLVGTYLWGFSNGIRRGHPKAGWLPSQGAPE
ncbi:MAG: hypothetical protein ACQEW8_13165 [Actinomycetota bacterium]